MTRENLISFSSEDLLAKIKLTMSQTRYRAYPVIGPDKKLLGLLSRYHLISTRKKKMILVDHNERSQSADGIEESEILEIIDHHRVADVFTGQPIYFRNEPVGSTATIVATIFFENGIQPSQQIAGILAAAIISDTLFFKSPTATPTDRLVLDRLVPLAKIDPEEFAMEMFRAGTSLKGRTAEDLLKSDLKIFTAGDEKIAVSQVYTLDPSSLEDQKELLLELMEEKAASLGYSVYVLMLTDIFNESSEMIMAGKNKERAAQAFGKNLENGSFLAPGVLSRKKQVIPIISNPV
jgi:manganese-dependent inorganic pyrophosphatase